MPISFDSPQSSVDLAPTQITSLSINGVARVVEVEATRPLLSVLRDYLDLTGTKHGCGEAQCGACVVLLDGQPVPSCTTPVSEAEGKTITTIEGLAEGDNLHPVQEAFVEVGAMQCGYCTPGMIMEAVALLRGNAAPDDAAIVAVMDRHICRCGTYARIVAAIKTAGNKMQGDTV
jgi:aerobic-type carbon monoxide dehydrogenase small subunit (CoxS/CutS family)